MSRASLIVTVLLLFPILFLLRFAFPFPFVLFVVGFVIGYFFHLLDRLVQLACIPEYVEQRKHFLSAVSRVRLLKAMDFLLKEIEPVIFSSAFLALYFPLAVYVITSTGSVIGLGVVIGLGLTYVMHLALSVQDTFILRKTYFSLVKRSVSDADIQKIVYAFMGLYTILVAFVVLS